MLHNMFYWQIFLLKLPFILMHYKSSQINFKTKLYYRNNVDKDKLLYI